MKRRKKHISLGIRMSQEVGTERTKMFRTAALWSVDTDSIREGGELESQKTRTCFWVFDISSEKRHSWKTLGLELLCTTPSVLTQPLWPGAGLGFSNNSLVQLLSWLKKQKPQQESRMQRHYRLFMRGFKAAFTLGEAWEDRQGLGVRNGDLCHVPAHMEQSLFSFHLPVISPLL